MSFGKQQLKEPFPRAGISLVHQTSQGRPGGGLHIQRCGESWVMFFVLSLGFSPFSWHSNMSEIPRISAQYVGPVFNFPKVYLCCSRWFARALLLSWFSGLILLQIIKKTKQQNPSQTHPQPPLPQHLTVPRLCGFPLRVLSAC